MIISITVIKHVAIAVRTPSTAVVGMVAAVMRIAVKGLIIIRDDTPYSFNGNWKLEKIRGAIWWPAV